MNAATAFARLSRLGVPAIRTSDAAAALGLSLSAASVALARMARAGLICRVRSGTWWVAGELDPLRLPEFLTAPMPSYVSLLSALSIHGMIEQLPQVTFAVSLSHSQRIKTAVGTISIHHIAPELFGGYAPFPSGIKVATPEKALFDLAYLSGGRSRYFASLPELELPARFRRNELTRWVKRIASARARTVTRNKLEHWLV